MSSASSPQNSSGSSIDFLKTSSYSRNTLRCCCELWKWRLGRAVPQRKFCVCATFCHEFHRLWEQIFPCTLFKRAAVWITRSIAILMCNPLIAASICSFENDNNQQPTDRDSVTRRLSRSRNWYTLSEPEGVKHDSHHVHHFKLMCQTLRRLFVQMDEAGTLSKHNYF